MSKPLEKSDRAGDRVSDETADAGTPTPVEPTKDDSFLFHQRSAIARERRGPVPPRPDDLAKAARAWRARRKGANGSGGNSRGSQ